jgi:hypothetical protein
LTLTTCTGINIVADYDYDGKGKDSGELDRFADFIRLEAPPIIRRELEQKVEGKLQGVESELRKEVPALVQDTILKVLRIYMASTGGIDGSALPSRSGDDLPAHHQTTTSLEFVAAETVAVGDLGIWSCDPFAFDLQEFMEVSAHNTADSDSGYGALSFANGQ